LTCLENLNKFKIPTVNPVKKVTEPTPEAKPLITAKDLEVDVRY